MTVTASQVKELRDRTGAGMMDCKRALQETDGDLEAARRLLRERGMAQAAKRAGRETTEGLVLVRVDDGRGSIVAVGCETEPVSKNDEFVAFAGRALDVVERSGSEATAELEPERVELSARLGENIVVRGRRLESGAGEQFGSYVHPPANKIGVLVKVKGDAAELARMLAMHVSFGAPAWGRREEVPEDVVESERQVYLNSDELQGKPEAAREKIVDGMLRKRFFAAQPGGVLLDQPWIHDTAKTVGQVLSEAGVELADFERYSVSG
jgi:elongation factor Ts